MLEMRSQLLSISSRRDCPDSEEQSRHPSSREKQEVREKGMIVLFYHRSGCYDVSVEVVSRHSTDLSRRSLSLYSYCLLRLS
jgi:hypothetical protein